MPRALVFVALLPLAACETTYPAGRARPHVMSETPTAKEVEGRATWGEPISIPGHSTWVVPYSRERPAGFFSDWDNFAEGGAASYFLARGAEGSPQSLGWRSGAVRWHNAAVVELESGAQWPLLEQRGVLSRYWMSVGPTGSGQTAATSLLFAATVEDTNDDGILNDLDATRALYCEPDGRNPRFISPEGTQLRGIVPIQQGRFFLMLARDADGDGVFSDQEPPEPYLPGLEGEARRLIDPEVRERIEALLAATGG